MSQPDAQALPPGFGEALVAQDVKSRELLGLARRVAAADVTVMLTGESGVGKELFARFIHEHSSRRCAPFVAINCAAIPDSMLEATLFGYEKGAFTGAGEARSGKFEQADGGTLLLDEITEMALSLQAKLLRALQEREVERLGAVKGRKVDVRVIATSNRDLREALAEGCLREDIYYRLNVFPLKIPPLRERPDDIPGLIRHLLARHVGAGEAVPEVAPAAYELLRAQRWPGNVRELDNVLQRALIVRSGAEIGVEDLAIEAVSDVDGHCAGERSGDLHSSLRASEGELILQALEAEDGRRSAAAERLGISPRTLRYKLARLREMGLAVP